MQRQRREEREPRDDADCDDGQRPDLRARRPRGLGRDEHDGAEQPRDDRAAECHQERIEVVHRESRRGQREREAQDAERAEQQARGQRCAPPPRPLRYRPPCSNVTPDTHD
jgi:hypothetical protein